MLKVLNHILTLNLKRISNMPQPTITSFFKSTKPTGENTDKLESEENGSDKRAAPDYEDEVVTKRKAVSSPLGTPSRGDNKNNLEDVKSNTSPNKCTTPREKELLASPLMDLNVVIRKKISNGAYALHENIGSTWFRALQAEFDKPYFKKLSNFVRDERRNKTVFPPENKVYSWTHHHAIKDTRVVIIGQDPYHAPGQAHGLSFSVQRGVRTPPSLINIFKELENDIPGFKTPPSGDLTGWAKQGVLMLNTCLTVNQGQANSHQNKGWENFTDAVITWISRHLAHKVVFILWGKPAQRKKDMIDKRHKVLMAAHPSPLSAYNGFFGCAHFSQTNQFLKSQDLPEIEWRSL